MRSGVEFERVNTTSGGVMMASSSRSLAFSVHREGGRPERLPSYEESDEQSKSASFVPVSPQQGPSPMSPTLQPRDRRMSLFFNRMNFSDEDLEDPDDRESQEGDEEQGRAQREEYKRQASASRLEKKKKEVFSTMVYPIVLVFRDSGVEKAYVEHMIDKVGRGWSLLLSCLVVGVLALVEIFQFVAGESLADMTAVNVNAGVIGLSVLCAGLSLFPPTKHRPDVIACVLFVTSFLLLNLAGSACRLRLIDGKLGEMEGCDSQSVDTTLISIVLLHLLCFISNRMLFIGPSCLVCTFVFVLLRLLQFGNSDQAFLIWFDQGLFCFLVGLQLASKIAIETHERRVFVEMMAARKRIRRLEGQLEFTRAPASTGLEEVMKDLQVAKEVYLRAQERMIGMGDTGTAEEMLTAFELLEDVAVRLSHGSSQLNEVSAVAVAVGNDGGQEWNLLPETTRAFILDAYLGEKKEGDGKRDSTALQGLRQGSINVPKPRRSQLLASSSKGAPGRVTGQPMRQPGVGPKPPDSPPKSQNTFSESVREMVSKPFAKRQTKKHFTTGGITPPSAMKTREPLFQEKGREGFTNSDGNRPHRRQTHTGDRDRVVRLQCGDESPASSRGQLGVEVEAMLTGAGFDRACEMLFETEAREREAFGGTEANAAADSRPSKFVISSQQKQAAGDSAISPDQSERDIDRRGDSAISPDQSERDIDRRDTNSNILNPMPVSESPFKARGGGAWVHSGTATGVLGGVKGTGDPVSPSRVTVSSPPQLRNGKAATDPDNETPPPQSVSQTDKESVERLKVSHHSSHAQHLQRVTGRNSHLNVLAREVSPAGMTSQRSAVAASSTQQPAAPPPINRRQSVFAVALNNVKEAIAGTRNRPSNVGFQGASLRSSITTVDRGGNIAGRQQKVTRSMTRRARTQIPKYPGMVPEGVFREWNFDMLEFEQGNGKQGKPPALVCVGLACLMPELEKGHLQCTEDQLTSFLHSIANLYVNNNKYHNATHGAEVCHLTLWLAQALMLHDRIASSRGVISIAIAALCHDVGHPGRSNKFLVNSRHDLALTYNDKSVLENMHAALTFKTMKGQNTTHPHHQHTGLNGQRRGDGGSTGGACDILSGLSFDHQQQVRKAVIDLILDTDVAVHFQSTAAFRVRTKASDFNLEENEEDQWLVARMCLKAADIGHSAVAWDAHVRWSVLVTREFWEQGDVESTMQIPISPLCDRTKDTDIPKSQIGFINFICEEQFTLLASVDWTQTIERECVEEQRRNKARWKELSYTGEEREGFFRSLGVRDPTGGEEPPEPEQPAEDGAREDGV
uniref:Phosphodiesterase n=1 Tax=Chromera velia CCMP2878 TaxID=1169474 RepID=A0A0G4IAV5_9ALVE|eukprot:Cvel_12576.t1-p1 / transcript=Cvel_12576.t1 / gene=Cvel_12576 / organism=Chromera_velia_CCMP2878 / gene_product=3',5'-cyclic-nucleotide phosphodiesterase regA, putative / transcript_product=3',5'-cyclic-nucleotide phosphodiesterase regA, putative / location=Cvel_scaffold828:28451-40613(+) / protein_length=1307 / sequence_SO=supercontig / SO=protein_coding / is_pseudo=false